MERKVDIASLKGVTILYKNDLHDLGRFVLRAFDARWRGTGSKARPTLYGLARIYGSILDCASKPFEEAIEAHGFPLGATVDDGSIERTRGSSTRARPNRRNRHRSE